ncbi:hypothetical protein ACNQUF_12515, partial [Corynebacterium diphtheriae]
MNDVHSLGRLIASAQERNGWSLRDLAARVEHAGYDMSHTSFARLKSTPVTSIKGENITMLALVLKVHRFGVHSHATAGVRGRLLPLASPRRLVAMNDVH